MRSPCMIPETPLLLKAVATAPFEPVKDGTVARLKNMVAAYNARFAQAVRQPTVK
jgi:hypothetical protein